FGRFMDELWIVGKETCRGFGWPYLLFAVLPLFVLRQTGRAGRNWLLALLAAFICVGPLMVPRFNPPGDLTNLDLIRPSFAAWNIVLALCTGMGLMLLGSLSVKFRRS
ncbi:MAG: hypothetical protein ACREIC_11505, partial [Limisphaerales bacterium]